MTVSLKYDINYFNASIYMIYNDVPKIFDRERLRSHQLRAAAGFSEYDFLFREMGNRLCERLEYINRDFPLALDLGGRGGILAEMLKGRRNIGDLIEMQGMEGLLCVAQKNSDNMGVVADEELLPFSDNTFDLIMSVGTLHWVNDLAGTLIQIKRSLKPDGLFLAVFFGGQTLHELRASFEKAEIECRGGVSPRISPFIDVQTGGSLLQRAGFALPVVDSEVVNVEYGHPLKLMKELRYMGETNCLIAGEKNFTPCSLMMSAVDHYLRDFSNSYNRINASFEIITLTGWKPHVSQQKPSARGSGKVSLANTIS